MESLFFRKKRRIQELEKECKLLKTQQKALEQQYLEDSQTEISRNTKRLLFTNLNQRTVYLIDYENISMIPKFILRDEKSVCYIFHGILQKSQILEEKRLHDFRGLHYFIQTKRTAKNSLDTLLSFYLGQIYSVYHPRAIFVISNDTDYSNLKQLSQHYPDIPYEQITLNEIRRREQNVTSDEFYKRFLLDYVQVYGTHNVQRQLFVKRLRGSKVHGMDTSAVQYALHRMEELHLIEEYSKRGNRYIRLLSDNIISLADHIVKLEESYVY